ncbi:MAG: hypothetical protein QNJ46_25710 [Leptolyngbyaceae cyanobacterium MO_188.B28]|nr:hypothetical protein [Leptolyngbyaceae cyanobacterium MO_188.B28]
MFLSWSKDSDNLHSPLDVSAGFFQSPERLHLNSSGARSWSDNIVPYRQTISASQSVSQLLEADQILNQLNSDQLWVVNSRRRNGIIIYKKFHAEFAGPGAAVGGLFDKTCQKVIPLGNLSLVPSTSHEDQQKALRIRLQWIRLTQNFTDKPVPLERAQMILEQFKNYFDQQIVDHIPDEAFAMLVGVFPFTVRIARSGL